jgi:hypothetical protein
VTIHLSGVALLVVAGAASVFVGSAAAQTVVAPTPVEQSMDAVPGATTTGQKYDGVVPGPTGRNPLPAAPAAGSHLVWTGFQMTTTGSRVFLQTTQQVQFDIKEGHPSRSGKSDMVVRLSGCRIHMANNRRKIDTRFFATPVSGISARQKGHDVEVRIALREPVSAVPHSEVGPEGTQFVVLDFPPGKATPEPSALEALAGGSAGPDGAQGESQGEGETSDGAAAPRKKPARKAAKSAR